MPPTAAMGAVDEFTTRRIRMKDGRLRCEIEGLDFGFQNRAKTRHCNPLGDEFIGAQLLKDPEVGVGCGAGVHKFNMQ